MNQETFLNTIRQSLPRAYLPDADASRPAWPKLPDFEPEQLVPQFMQEVTSLKGTVYQVQTQQAAVEQIIEIFTAHPSSAYLAWGEAALPIANLKAQLAQKGWIERSGFVPGQGEPRRETLANLAELAIGLTGATAGLADTGSVVVSSAPGQGRLVSLLPPVHIVLLKTSQLWPSLAHFIQAQPDAARQTSNLVIITGPSRTADIEQVITLGVHGPRELHVVLI